MILAPQAIDQGELAMLGQAKAIFEWHKSHKYCSNCGAESTMVEAGYKRVCHNCNNRHIKRENCTSYVSHSHCLELLIPK